MRRSGRPTTALGAVLVTLAMVLASCGGDDDLDPDVVTDTGAAGTESAADASAAATPPSSEPTSAAPASEPTAAPTTADGTTGDGDFCSELEGFLAAWLGDEIGPADLTGEYQRLAGIAPNELVDDFQVLASGNEEVLSSGELSNPGAYDASGAAMAAYAMDVCGIELDG